MREQAFWKPIEPGFTSQGLYVHRVSDRARGETKPCDYLICAGGRFCALECKLTVIKRTGDDWQPQPQDVVARFTDLRPSQQSALPDVEAARGFPMIGLGLYARRYGVTVRRAWVFPLDGLREFPVIRYGDLQPRRPGAVNCYELTWQPGTGWLLSDFWLRRIPR